MVCQACGQPVATEVRFCPHCGVQVAEPPMAPPQPVVPPPVIPVGYGAVPMYLPVPRVQRNLQALGILWCVYGAYRVVSGLVGMFFLRAMTMSSFGYYGWHMHDNYGWSGAPWMGALIPVVGFVSVVAAVLSFAVGLSLLTRKPWGRTLGIVVAVLTLFRPLLGTALGIYTLWVLAPAQSGLEYDAIADRS